MSQFAGDATQLAATFAKLGKSASFGALNARDFVQADLDQLAKEGIFPEDDLLLSFRS